MLERVPSWVFKQRKNFDEFPSWLVGGLGVMAFLIAGYLGLLLGDVVPDFIREVNRSGINVEALELGGLLSVFGLALWFFGCIAARCHGILYQRWFR